MLTHNKIYKVSKVGIDLEWESILYIFVLKTFPSETFPTIIVINV